MKTKKKILIVEDEEVIRALFRRLIAPLGHETIFAEGVKKALESIAVLDDLDLLITDMKLPDGSGIEVIEAFGSMYPGTRVLIVTGSPTSESMAGQLQEMGFSEKNILFKPFEKRDFESVLDACLTEASDES